MSLKYACSCSGSRDRVEMVFLSQGSKHVRQSNETTTKSPRPKCCEERWHGIGPKYCGGLENVQWSVGIVYAYIIGVQ